MGAVDGLFALVEASRDYFASQGADVVVGFGEKAHSQIFDQAATGAGRVIFMAGKIDPNVGAPKAVEAGEFTEPRKTSDNPRPLAWWSKIFTVGVWAYDPAEPDSDLAQYKATCDLLELTYQALHRAVWTGPDGSKHIVGTGDVQIESAFWVRGPVEQALGRELLFYARQDGPLFDQVIPTRTPTAAIDRPTT
jgi:hypothetical protein